MGGKKWQGWEKRFQSLLRLTARASSITNNMGKDGKKEESDENVVKKKAEMGRNALGRSDKVKYVTPSYNMSKN